MKKATSLSISSGITLPIILFICFTFNAGISFAQSGILNRIERKIQSRTNRKIDQSIDNGLDSIEDGMSGKGKKSSKKSIEPNPESEVAELAPEPTGKPTASANTDSPEISPNTDSEQNPDISQDPPAKAWSKYDFVSGHKIIFYDDQAGEQNGEFPSKWDLIKGSSENVSFGDLNTISFSSPASEIKPLMKSVVYLPKIFTVEFDIYFYQKGNEAYTLQLKGWKNITLRANTASSGNFKGEAKSKLKQAGWRHVAISFNKRALKCYMDEDRLLNIPNIETKPTSISISALSHGSRKDYPSMIRNIHIAEGGVKLYDRLSTDGKIITHGIRFDVGKSSIKPESSGTIADFVQMLNEHSELKFSIEGHTDSDGQEVANQKLSEARASAVKKELVRHGIAENRLKTLGWGETKPIDNNSSSEGKAQNRRVEFIKF